MAAPAKSAKPVPAPAKAAPKRFPAKLVEFEAPTGDDDQPAVQADLPDDWRGPGTTQAGAFNPTPRWREPGEYVDGEYLGMSTNRGPNASRLYHLRLREGTFIDVWGSTALDNRMDDAFRLGLQPGAGQHVFIQYLGTQPTKRGANPVKVFNVIFK